MSELPKSTILNIYKDIGMITQERLKELVSYNPETGIFIRILALSPLVKVGDKVGGLTSTGYRRMRLDQITYKSHRLAWLYVHGSFPIDQIDHINGIRDDNRISNLRCTNHSENMRNRAMPKHNTSGICGVYWAKSSGKWLALIHANRGIKYLGVFLYKWEAICARKSAENKYGYHENHGRNSQGCW